MWSDGRATDDDPEYSIHPMTRASTAEESDQVITPLDDLGYDLGTKDISSYNRDSGQRSDDNFDLYDFHTRHMAARMVDGKSRRTRAEVEPHGPYFSRPRDQTAKSTSLARRRTAKELIGRYESMNSSCSATPRSAVKGSVNGSVNRNNLYSPAAEKRVKGRSPIRQSFRNLLSVFSKKARRSSKDGQSISASKTPPHQTAVAQTISPRRLSSIDIPRANASFGKLTAQDAMICNTPGSLHTGSLLYLCRSTTSNSFPVWTTCTAVLHPSHVLITWHTSFGNPSTSIVTLAHCTDVRSLALKDLDDAERDLLPSGTTEVKVFELLFEGRAREKFAANSVQDRAGWVSAIWDAILQTQECRSYLSPSGHDALSISEQSSYSPSLQQCGRTVSQVKSTASIMTSVTDRALPALPAPVSPIRISLYDPPAPRNTPSPIPNRISLQTPPPSRAQSPSIRNLDQRSVVKQRLAQIERSNSEESARSNLTPTKSTRTRQYTSSLLTPKSARTERNQCLARQDTTESAAEQSIIESYADSGRESPFSTSSGKLTAVTSTRTSRTRVDEIKKQSNPPRQDLFSPASQYSNEERHQPFGVPFQLHHISGLPMQESRPPPLVFTGGGGVQAKTTLPEPPKPSPKLDLDDRLASLKAEVLTLATARMQAPTIVSTDEHTKQALRGIDDSVKRIEDHELIHGQNLSVLRAQVETVLAELRAHADDTAGQAIAAPFNMEEVTKNLEAMRAAMSSQLPQLIRKVELLGRVHSDTKEESVTMQNVAPASAEDDKPHVADATSTAVMDISPLAIEEKLNQLLILCQTLQVTNNPRVQLAEGEDQNKEVQEILELIKNEQAQRAEQAEQQADSVRYLNELNSWLEAFVNHGTSQIDSVVAGVQQLCKELGPVSELQNLASENDGKPLPGGLPNPAGNLLADFRSFLLKDQEREENTTILQASVNGLVAAVQEDLRRNAESRNQLTTESIVGLIERQRQDQERMLRLLATDLSNDIRGERLRFVDAMKEATAINVQIHVEEFKKELTREVLLMTQEVGRLQKERQSLEQQIADLFGFYAKQKQGSGAPQASRLTSAPGLTVPNLRRALPSMRRRPLPTPSPGPYGISQ
ncbi:unnamed protein product [Somion occarium]|uniref:PH domain-containing protein n=1 Tax=Somion occarium TaxID=3059160 RepID=A0ABP1DHD5_9APHY